MVYTTRPGIFAWAFFIFFSRNLVPAKEAGSFV